MCICRKYLCAFFAVLATSHALAGKKIDSLLGLIETAKTDTVLINLHNQVAELYNYNNPESMLKHAEIANKLCKKMHFPKGEFYALHNIATACYITGAYGKGLKRA
ncbi:MAG TPA: hypothetical protein VD905_05415, partial [Flavobacteriales bacterium]|nr:hypothetical protein [Flavobacteriales bacterium]